MLVANKISSDVTPSTFSPAAVDDDTTTVTVINTPPSLMIMSSQDQQQQQLLLSEDNNSSSSTPHNDSPWQPSSRKRKRDESAAAAAAAAAAASDITRSSYLHPPPDLTAAEQFYNHPSTRLNALHLLTPFALHPTHGCKKPPFLPYGLPPQSHNLPELYPHTVVPQNPSRLVGGPHDHPASNPESSSQEVLPLYVNATAAPSRLPAHKPVRLNQPKHPLAPPGTPVYFKYGEEHYPEETIPDAYTYTESDGTVCRYITNFLVYNKRGERLLPIEVLVRHTLTLAPPPPHTHSSTKRCQVCDRVCVHTVHTVWTVCSHTLSHTLQHRTQPPLAPVFMCTPPCHGCKSTLCYM